MNADMRELVERCASLQRRLDAALALADDSVAACGYWDEQDDWGPDCEPHCDCSYGTVYHRTLRAALTGTEVVW